MMVSIWLMPLVLLLGIVIGFALLPRGVYEGRWAPPGPPPGAPLPHTEAEDLDTQPFKSRIRGVPDMPPIKRKGGNPPPTARKSRAPKSPPKGRRRG